MSTTDFPGGSGGPGSWAGTRTGDETGGMQEQAQEKAQQVAGTAADEGRHVAGTAREEAQNVASEARAQARNLMSEATTQLEDQSRTQKDRLTGTVRTFGDDLDQMAGQQEGLASEVARQVAERARGLSDHLDARDPRELLADVRDYARRRPGTFLLGALAAGVVAGRFARAAQAGARDGAGSTVGVPSGAPATPAQPPLVADVTTPADPLTAGAGAVSSGPGSAGTDVAGTAAGDPLTGARLDEVGTTYPVAEADADTPRLDPRSTP